MAVKKTKQKAELNLPKTEEKTLNKREKKKIQKKIKAFGVKSLCLFIAVLVLGGVAGGLTTYLISKKDEFTLLGQDEQILTINERYYEDGYKVVEFGKDKNNKVKIQTDLKINEDGSFSPQLDSDGTPMPGTYYIIYKVDSFKYSTLSKIERIRLITFVENSDDSLEVE